MNFWQKNSTLIIAASIFTCLLFLPSVILPSCPKGLINDSFPGRCGLYVDENQDRICDLSQTETTPTPQKTFNFSFAWPTAVFFIFLTTAIILAIKVKPALRLVLLGLSLVFGFFTFKNLCPIAFLQFLIIFKDQAVLNFFPFLIFLVVIISTIIFGRIFCGWLCPIGASQELLHKLTRLLKLKPPEVNKKVPPVFKLLPFFILLVIGFLVVRSGKTVFCQLDPFGYLFGLSTSLVLLAALAFLFFLSFFIFRPFCLFLCPLGAIFSGLAHVSIWRIKRNKKICSDCGICYQKCPVGAIDKNFKIDQKTCLRCQQCLTDCPKKALSYQP
jgi:polyferredoxin